MHRAAFLTSLPAFFASALPRRAVAAQGAFPNRPVSLIVPLPAGGGVDINARALAPFFGKALGQQVLVRNIAGSGGIVGNSQGASATPDGYTLLMATNFIADASWLDAGVSVKPSDFTYLGIVALVPNLLLVRNDSPFKTLADVVAAAKKSPGTVSVGSVPGWASTDVARARFEQQAGIKLKIIEGFGGGAPELNGLLAGTIDVSFNNINESIALIEGGKVRVLAVSSTKRSPFLPNAKTFSEQGLNVAASVWRGVAAPAATPKPVIDVLAAALGKAMADPDLAAEYKKIGLSVDYENPEESRRYVTQQYDNDGALFKQLGVAISR